MGEWGAWIKEMAAARGGGDLHPFYRVGFAEVRAAWRPCAATGRRPMRQMEIGQCRRSRARQPARDGQRWHSRRRSIAMCRGDWTAAAKRRPGGGEGPATSASTAPDLALEAAVAGASRAELAAAIPLLRPPRATGRMADAALAAAEAGNWRGAAGWEEARAGYPQALSLRHQARRCPSGAFDGLNWGLLAGRPGSRGEDRETEAEAFFAWRGGTPMVNAYKAAFVPVATVSAAAPPASVTRSEVPAARS